MRESRLLLRAILSRPLGFLLQSAHPDSFQLFGPSVTKRLKGALTVKDAQNCLQDPDEPWEQGAAEGPPRLLDI
jgi:hypothetical protein